MLDIEIIKKEVFKAMQSKNEH